MAMQEIVVLVSDKQIRELENLAKQRHVAREQIASEIFQDALRRESVRARIFAEMDERQKSPKWNETFEHIATFRANLPDIPEDELETDIEEAIRYVRSHPKE